ncbi:MAG TPA: phosphatidate cytidylyltransferase [Rhizomicrobium sp.]|nr:phosphatidate cytidylyltransferase [Rhizomicrobium sp.]
MSQQHLAPVGRSFSEGVLRVLFGLFMAFIAVALTLYSAEWFAVVTVLMILFGAREWHRMVRSPAEAAAGDQQPILVQTAITGATIAGGVMALFFRFVPLAFVFLVIGTVLSFEWARRQGDNPAWHAGGVLYLGLPCLALVSLRVFPAQGALTVLGLFMIVWATDTGALVFGKLIGGRKIAPRLSPGKTWAGTIGGSITAAMVFGLYIALFGFNAVAAMLFALVFSLAAHGGDLFESLVKRHFGYKDSGGLIPGHGGILDRVDSLFAASLVMALLVFGLHFNPMFGGRV